jgi:hypothetical protein
LTCANGSTVYKPQSFVEVEIPCSCALHSDYGNYAGKTMQCARDQDYAPTYSFPVNLPLLTAFFSEDEISSLSTSSVFKEPLPVILPNISIFHNKYSQNMASIRQDSLQLDHVANLTQQNAQVFRSQADQILYQLTNSNLQFESSALSIWSWQTLLLLATTALCLILTFGVYLLFGRYKALALVLTVANRVPQTLAAPTTRSPLNYFRGTTTTLPPLPLVPFEWDYRLPMLDLLLLFILVTAFLIIGVQFYRQYIALNDSFQLLLELGNAHQRVMIRLLTLPQSCHMYKFLVSTPIEDALVTGCFWPELQLNWPGVTISNRHTHVTYPLPRIVSLSWVQAYQLRTILEAPHYTLLFNYAFRRLGLIKMPRRAILPPQSNPPSLYPLHMLSSYAYSPQTLDPQAEDTNISELNRVD